MSAEKECYIIFRGPGIGTNQILFKLVELIKKIFPVKSIQTTKEEFSGNGIELKEKIHSDHVNPDSDVIIFMDSKMENDKDIGTTRPFIIRIHDSDTISISLIDDLSDTVISYFSDFYNGFSGEQLKHRIPTAMAPNSFAQHLENRINLSEKNYDAIKKYFSPLFIDAAKEIKDLKQIRIEYFEDADIIYTTILVPDVYFGKLEDQELGIASTKPLIKIRKKWCDNGR